MASLYIEANTGISGDMIVGMLLDLGANQEKLEQVLRTIPDDSFRIKISRVQPSGIDCCDFDVILDEAHDGHDHDMDYLYGHLHEHSHTHEHSHAHTHTHDHEHSHDHDHGEHAHEYVHEHVHTRDHNHHGEHAHAHTHEHDHSHSHDHDHGEHAHEHSHVHRSLSDVFAIIDEMEMTDGARKIAKRTFEILAEAEAKAHAKPIDEVHFHEVGAIDSIVDIVAAGVCLDDLSVDDVIVTKLTEGSGTIRCQHGILPVPVPAVANIAAAHSIPMELTKRVGEYVTPTGAAFVAAVMTKRELPETLVIEKIGMGAGKRKHEIPGILRGMLLH